MNQSRSAYYDHYLHPSVPLFPMDSSERSVKAIGCIDLFDGCLLLGVVLLSSWVVFVLNFRQGHNHIWIGTDGIYVADQMQFVGWVQSASQHILISNLFSTSRSPADFLQPGIVASGLLVLTRAWTPPRLTTFGSLLQL